MNRDLFEMKDRQHFPLSVSEPASVRILNAIWIIEPTSGVSENRVAIGGHLIFLTASPTTCALPRGVPWPVWIDVSDTACALFHTSNCTTMWYKTVVLTMYDF